ncbi:hypothetical protein [Actinoplanes sp. NPDC023714]|uniref:hypothetical protein n=1 Tax=Actinoplanes sp. NPDC023714 TaxID=3154322 RepID=UPI00340131F5
MTTKRDADHPVARHGPPAIPESGPRLLTTLCGAGSCPTVYDTGGDTVLVQGHAASGVEVPEGELLVEIPRELLLQAARLILEQDA